MISDFREADYVYEPGQFAVRGSILDVYSYSCEYPFRIDFFGDEIDTIRTFNIEDQLSKDKRDAIEIVPELAAEQSVKQCFLHFLDADALVVMNDYTLAARPHRADLQGRFLYPESYRTAGRCHRDGG